MDFTITTENHFSKLNTIKKKGGGTKKERKLLAFLKMSPISTDLDVDEVLGVVDEVNVGVVYGAVRLSDARRPRRRTAQHLHSKIRKYLRHTNNF